VAEIWQKYWKKNIIYELWVIQIKYFNPIRYVESTDPLTDVFTSTCTYLIDAIC